MKNVINISIPMPLIVSIEDVGWWSGTDGSAYDQPFRTGMQRAHVPQDYTALAALGRGLDMRIQAGFVLCEWDKENLLRKLPSSTWMGEKWIVPSTTIAQKEAAAEIIKKEQAYIEFALHGIGHEFWADGKMERSEFHDSAGNMRERDEIKKHLACFFAIMDQYGLDCYPRIFIPPALKHSFGNREAGFQHIISQFGIRYVSLMFKKAKWYAVPQTHTIAWENDVLLVERGAAEVNWHTSASEPCFQFDRPVMALHWANILHPDPERNLEVIKRWVAYIREKSEKKAILLARDTQSCFTQYLHKVMSTIRRTDQEIIVDVRWIKNVPSLVLGKAIFIKIETPPGIEFKISGAEQLPANRPCETPFLKLSLPRDKEIRIMPFEKE